jgi:hypothetical protein
VGAVQGGYITNADSDYDDEQQENILHIASEPSLDFTRKIWWDSLLCLYNSTSSHYIAPLTPSQRESVSRSITDDLRFLFKSSNYWFAFFHVPTFFGNYFDAQKRERMQPSLILAALAMATFWQSSEIGNGRAGRERALRFRDEAQGALEASFNARWIDETLAQAAWVNFPATLPSQPSDKPSQILAFGIIRGLRSSCAFHSALHVIHGHARLYHPQPIPHMCRCRKPDHLCLLSSICAHRSFYRTTTIPERLVST